MSGLKWRCGHDKNETNNRLENGKPRRCKTCWNRKRNERRHTPEGHARWSEETLRYRQGARGRATRERWNQSPKAIAARLARFKFLGREIWPAGNPRTGYCSECGIHYLQTPYGYQHAMHHAVYDENDPLAYTRELCWTDHRRVPTGVIVEEMFPKGVS